MIRTILTGAKDFSLGVASCIPVIGPCVIVPGRFLASMVSFGVKFTFYGVKNVVMLPINVGSAVITLFHKTPKGLNS